MQSSGSSLPSSPILSEGYGSGKRPLTEVKEEDQEKDEDYEMVSGFKQYDDIQGMLSLFLLWPSKEPSNMVNADVSTEEDYPPSLAHLEWGLDGPDAMRYFEENFKTEAFGHEYTHNPIAKRQRGDASPLSGIASKVSSRMPSISRKFRSRKASPNVAIPSLSRETSVSRANSTRAPSFASANMEYSKTSGNQAPPTPAASYRHDSFDNTYYGVLKPEQDDEPNDGDFRDRPLPGTPLLPPTVDAEDSDQMQEVQSPLQSPSVAEPSESDLISPISPIATPQIGGLPSPPLSTKPSIASFHRRQYGSPIIPSSEIPPMLISNRLPDKWADLLGHADFTIQPEPYLPTENHLSACKTLRADWDMARYNYTKHLMRVGENFGPTSNIYHLTQEKWTEIDVTWKKNVELSLAQLQPQDDAPSTPSSPIIKDPVGRHLAKTPPLVKIPSLNGPRSEGKFPKVGDEGIVGPMSVDPPRSQANQPSDRARDMTAQLAVKKKRKFGGFIKDWLIGVGMFGNKGAQEAT